MAGKIYEIALAIKGKIDSSLGGSVASAAGSLGGLASHVSGLNSRLANISGYQRQRTATLGAAKAYQEAQRRVRELAKAHAQNPTKKTESEMRKASATAEKLSLKYKNQTARLTEMRGVLQGAGVNTRNLTQEQAKLNAQLERAAVVQRNLRAARDSLAASKARLTMGNIQSELMTSAAFLMVMAGPVKAAMAFEEEMAGVRKVVSFDTPEQFAEMGRDITALATKIPTSVTGLAKIAAAAGQAGIARQDIVAFTEDAAKMGVAFNITADEAGQAMAQWRTAFRMNQEQVRVLADQINFLGNTSAATQSKITSVVTRIGPLGEVAGVASSQIAALGATMIATGTAEDVAATGIKNFMRALTAGKSASKRQREVMKQLRLDPETLAKEMLQDPEKVMTGILQRIGDLPKHAQNAALSNLFGRESVAAIAPMLTNLDLLKENFGKVGDASKYAGSVEKEFQIRSQTTANTLQIMRNKLSASGKALGNYMLPWVASGATMLGTFADKVAWVAETFPGMTKGVLGVVAGMGSLKVALTAGSLLKTALGLPFKQVGVWVREAQAIMLTGAVDAQRKGSLFQRAVVGSVRGLGKVAGMAKRALVSAAKASGLFLKSFVASSWGGLKTFGAWIVKTAIPGIWSFTGALLSNPITWVVAGVAALAVGVYALWKNWDDVCALISGAWDWLMDKLVGGWEWFTGLFSWKGSVDWSWLSGGFGAAIDVIMAGGSRITGFFTGLPGKISGALSGAWEGLTSLLSGKEPIDWSWVSAGFGEVMNGVFAGPRKIVAFFAGLPGEISPLLSGLGDIIAGPFKIASGIIEGVFGKLRSLWEGFTSLFTSDVKAFDAETAAKVNSDAASVNANFAGSGILGGRARGGLASIPGVYTLAERGKEMVVPLASADKNLGLQRYAEAGRMLGVPQGGAGAHTFSPTVNIHVSGDGGGGSARSIAEEVERVLKRLAREEARVGFA